jgi:ankyrin repeat protein
VTTGSLPSRPNLDQLKRQAKELLRREPHLGRLRDAQRALAQQYGFASWDALRAHVESIVGSTSRAGIKPKDLESGDARLIWDTIAASADGDAPALRKLLERNGQLSRAQYWYTPAVHFAVREGHAEAVQVLLDAGADPEWNGFHDGSLVEMARERGHTRVARLLEQARDRRNRVSAQPVDHPIHVAAEHGDLTQVRALLDVDPSLVDRGDAAGGTPLHRAILGRAREVVELLLDRGADVHVFHGAARGLRADFWTDVQAIDFAIWGGRRRRGDINLALLLLARGATLDLTVASALGDVERVRHILKAEPARIREARPSGRRPLSAAIQFGHDDIARLLLDSGADPSWKEPGAPKGMALHAAANRGNRAMVELLLDRGADPNGTVESSGSPTFIASTTEIRRLLVERGGILDPYLHWLGEDDEFMRRIVENPQAISSGEAFTTACTLGKRELLDRLLQAGIRVPEILTECQTYLLEHTDMLRTMLAHGMSPDLMNWQRQTLLHFLCAREDPSGAVERAAILLDAGANISARDDEYRSTPLAWAARTNAVQMAEFLLGRGAMTNLPDDDAWATPLAWAERRGHAELAAILRRHGAER